MLEIDKDYKDFLMRQTHKKNGAFKLKESIAYWESTLLEKTMELIELKSDYIDTEELKKQLLVAGMSCVRRSEMFNNYGAYYCTPSDITGQYYGKPLTVNYMSPQESGTETVGTSCVLFRNTPLYMPLYPLVQRYASMLAHADITIILAFVKMRMYNNVYSATNDDTAKQIEKFFENAYYGELGSIVDDVGDGIQILSAVSEGTISLTDMLEARENILTMYFNDIGIQSAKNKKGNILVPEIESAKPRLLISLNDMLKEWKKGCIQTKRLFGFDITAELSEEVKNQFESLDIENKGVNK